jgi:hypothetical protein
VLKSALRGKRDIAKKYTIWYTRAGKHTWKKVELENALSERRGLESTLGRQEIGLESTLSGGQGLESPFRKR